MAFSIDSPTSLGNVTLKVISDVSSSNFTFPRNLRLPSEVSYKPDQLYYSQSVRLSDLNGINDEMYFVPLVIL